MSHKKRKFNSDDEDRNLHQVFAAAAKARPLSFPVRESFHHPKGQPYVVLAVRFLNTLLSEVDCAKPVHPAALAGR